MHFNCLIINERIITQLKNNLEKRKSLRKNAIRNI